jgi:hypothetical protein
MKHAWAVLAMAAASAAVGAEAPPPSPATPATLAGFSGAWRLDPARSDDAREKLRAQRDRERGDAGGRPGGGMGRPGGGMGGFGGGRRGGGGPGARRDGGNPESREAVRDLVEGAPALTITASEQEIVLVEGDGRIRRLRPDGQKVKHELVRSESRARWEGDRLLNETWLDGGRTHIVETWSLDSEGADLLATLRLESQRLRGEPLTLKRTYVRGVAAPPGGGEP